MSKYLKAIYWFFIITLLFTGLLLISVNFKYKGAPKLFVVESGSMGKAVPIGGVAVTVPFSSYQKGDVITFANSSQNVRQTTTHRIVSVENASGHNFYKTKGDVNKTIDREEITESQILGKVVLTIPFAGYIISFTKSLQGFILFVIVPATIIVYSELLMIKQEIKKTFKKRKKTLYDLLLEQKPYREIGL